MTAKLTENRIVNMEYEEKKSAQKSMRNFQLSIFNFQFSTRSTRGFTLVETLVAITILLISVVGPISLIGDALHKLYYARDQMIAINLAQEGIEAVRQKRDSNMLGGVAWDGGIMGLGGPYIIDVGNLSSSVVGCPCGSNILPVYFDSLTGMYRQSLSPVATYNPSQFSRIVRVEDISGVEKKVTSIVTWKTGGQTGTITVSENLFKWAI